MNTLVALAVAIRPRIIRLAEVLSARIVRFAEVLTAKVGSLLSAIAHRARPLVAPLAEASFAPPFAVAAAMIVAAAGLPAFAPFALLGLRHLAVACLLHAVLRLAPWHRLAPTGRGLRTAMAIGLLWLAAASFGAGQAISPIGGRGSRARAERRGLAVVHDRLRPRSRRPVRPDRCSRGGAAGPRPVPQGRDHLPGLRPTARRIRPITRARPPRSPPSDLTLRHRTREP